MTTYPSPRAIYQVVGRARLADNRLDISRSISWTGLDLAMADALGEDRLARELALVQAQLEAAGAATSRIVWRAYTYERIDA